MPVGTTTIDFGAAPGSQRATSLVSGLSGLVAGQHIEAFLMSEASTDHSDYEHQMAAMITGFTCAYVDATSFMIFGVSEIMLNGIWNLRWVHTGP